MVHVNLLVFYKLSYVIKDKYIENQDHSLSIMDLLFSGGAGALIIMMVLFVLLFIALYIYLERLFVIKSVSKYDKSFMQKISNHVGAGKIDEAKKLCAETDNPVARLTEKGISRIGNPLEDINKAIENAGRLEVYKLEKNVGILATVAGAAPMIGFLGTVIGMILAFHNLASSSGTADMGVLAEGIYTAMTTTVGGLVVGIVAYVGYNHLVVKTDKVIYTMESQALDFLDLLNEPN